MNDEKCFFLNKEIRCLDSTLNYLKDSDKFLTNLKKLTLQQQLEELEQLEKVLIIEKCSNFEDCIHLARNNFEEFFSNCIKQLLFNFPADLKTESGGQIHGQSRNFQYSQARNVVQTDLTPKGKDAGAKLGKVSSVAMDKFFSDLGMTRPSSATKHPHIPPVGKWDDADKKYWINLFNIFSYRK